MDFFKMKIVRTALFYTPLLISFAFGMLPIFEADAGGNHRVSRFYKDFEGDENAKWKATHKQFAANGMQYVSKILKDQLGVTAPKITTSSATTTSSSIIKKTSTTTGDQEESSKATGSTLQGLPGVYSIDPNYVDDAISRLSQKKSPLEAILKERKVQAFRIQKFEEVKALLIRQAATDVRSLYPGKVFDKECAWDRKPDDYNVTIEATVQNRLATVDRFMANRLEEDQRLAFGKSFGEKVKSLYTKAKVAYERYEQLVRDEGQWNFGPLREIIDVLMGITPHSPENEYYRNQLGVDLDLSQRIDAFEALTSSGFLKTSIKPSELEAFSLNPGEVIGHFLGEHPVDTLILGCGHHLSYIIAEPLKLYDLNKPENDCGMCPEYHDPNGAATLSFLSTDKPTVVANMHDQEFWNALEEDLFTKIGEHSGYHALFENFDTVGQVHRVLKAKGILEITPHGGDLDLFKDHEKTLKGKTDQKPLLSTLNISHSTQDLGSYDQLLDAGFRFAGINGAFLLFEKSE